MKPAKIRLTAYESRVLRVLNRYVTAYLRKHTRKALRSSVHSAALMLDSVVKDPQRARDQVAHFVPWLSALSPNKIQPTFLSGPITGLVTRCIVAKLGGLDLEQACCDIVRLMQPDAAAIEMECMLPLPRKEKQSAPDTLVGRRAAAASLHLRHWERRLALAKSKVAKYRKKVAYYEKKGVA